MKWANVTLFIKNIAKLHTYKHTYTLALAAAADLKSAMENGSLCQVVLNKDFFQYGCNRVHLSSSSYVVMVWWRGLSLKKDKAWRQHLFFSFSLLSLFVVQGISRYHTIWDLLFKATIYRAEKSTKKLLSTCQCNLSAAMNSFYHQGPL